MRITHLYTGDDQKSHFGEIDIPLDGNGPYGSQTFPLPVESVNLRESPADRSLDFHPAPRRQLVITLRGQVEIEIGDGTKRRLGPGEVFLADDTSGQGHITRNIGGTTRHSVVIPLSPDFDPAKYRA